MTNGTDTFTLTLHRQGYGALTFEGRTWTPLEWVERIARRGGTLAAGEGKLLTDRIDQLESTIDRLEALLYEAPAPSH